MRFENKVVMVTGAGSGIGKEIACRFAQEGAAVIVAYRSVESGLATANGLQSDGYTAFAVQGDVGRPGDVERMVKAGHAHFNGLDVLVCAAGISPMGSVTETSVELWEETLRIDLTGLFLCCKFALPIMLERGSGVIVNIAGTLGLYAMPQKAAYCAAKAGVINLTRQMAIDYGHQGVRVNCVCPGFVDTPLNARIRREDREFFLQRLPLPFPAAAKDIADAVLYLASENARYVTGSALVVDGGQSTGML